MRGSSGLELFVDDGENRGANVVPMSADFDGDGTADIASWNPSTGKWIVYASGDGFRRTSSSSLGSDGSIPVPADYDGDGDAEIAVFEKGRWKIQGQENRRFGKGGDIPVPSDYDGDGVVDPAVFRPSKGRWYISGQSQVHFGAAGDVPVPADFNGDGQVDLAVYRPSTSVWYVRDQFRVQFGEPGDEPVPMDTDGDGRAEVVVHRPSNGTWFLFDPGTGASIQVRYGERGDVPIGVAPFRVLTSGSDGDSTPPDGDSDGGGEPETDVRGPCDGLRRGTGTERDRHESPPAAARPIASAAAPAAPAPGPPGGVPAPAARRAPSASAPRPDTPAGCRHIAPSPRRSSRSSSRPPHRQREALLRGPGPLAEQLDLHRQLPDVTLRRVEHLRHWLAVTILSAELEASHGPLPPRFEPVDLHAHLTGQRLQRFATQEPQHHVALPAGAPPLPRRQGARPGRRPIGTDSSRPPGSLRPRRSLCLSHVPRPNHFPHLLGHWILP